MNFDLQGKKIFVTGGSRGIGAAIVRCLAEQGALVAFTYSSRPESADQILKSLVHPDKHLIVQMNVADEQSVETACSTVLEKWGQIDGVVNNAGITKDGLFVRMKTEDFDNVIQTNLRGSFLVSKFFSKSMMKARSGSIVNISSVIGATGNAGQVNYSASKAGLVGMTKSIALELASRNVRANCVAPGFIATEMTDVLTDEAKQKITSEIPMEKIGEGSDVAYAVAFLLSDKSRYITGQTIHVNGGMFLN